MRAVGELKQTLLVGPMRRHGGDHVALLGDEGQITFADLMDETQSWVAKMTRMSVTAGVPVGLCLPDGLKFVAALLAAEGLGLNTVLLPSTIRPGELRRVAGGFGLRFLLTEQGPVPEQPRPIATGPIATDGGFGGTTGQVCLLTSGTTGDPKAVRHTARTLLAPVEAYGRAVLHLGPGDVVLSLPRLSFGYGLGMALLFPLALGAQARLLQKRPSAEHIAREVRDHGVTVLALVPTMVRSLLEQNHPSRTLASLRVVVCAGEPLPPSLARRWHERYPQIPLWDGLGTSETVHMIVSNGPHGTRPGTLGRAVPGYELRVLTREGEPCAAGEQGQLWVKGPSVAHGYLGDHISSRSFSGGGFLTPDLVTRDGDGFYTYGGRVDHLVKVKGLFVSPVAVERCLNDVASVDEALVVPRPDSDGLNQLEALVVARKPTHEKLLREYLRTKLPPYMCPSHFRFVKTLPRNHRGKVMR